MASNGEPELKVGEARVFGSLIVRERILETPTRTISIPSIASISVGTTETKAPPALLVLGAILLIGAFINGFTSAPTWGREIQLNPASIIMALIGAAFIFYFVSYEDTTHYLIISTNDGARSMFTAPKREILNEVRRLLTEKINSGNEAATYTINFKEARIETLHAGELSGKSIVVGDNNQVAVDAPGSRVGSPGDDIRVSRSPGAQVGHGNISSGNINIQKIDYSRFVPQITQMRDHYARYPEAADTTAKLDELLGLMRSGTPDASSKSRLRTIAGDIGKMLESYPAFSQLFRDIVGLLS